jgi:hypothetical protein
MSIVSFSPCVAADAPTSSALAFLVQVRYRDGQVVSCKGDKYIIEKVGEEWDGGSKGKVYTKGKRGVGYR